ncbi:MAG: ABC transporter ATP-binding protein [Planctomycetaceae bacterium]
MLKLDNISKTYRGAQPVCAVDGVGFSVSLGEFVAVQGPSGCGKTTLLLIAGGLLAPDSGTVTVAGEDPYAIPPDRRARFRASNVGFVFQQFHLVPYLSVLDNVLSAAVATKPPDAKRRADALIAKFGLERRAHHVPGELSTGERQRTALARALLNRPKLILADEPTGNLDRDNAETVLDDLSEFAKSGDGAVLMVTHDDHAMTFATRVEKMSEGRLTAEHALSQPIAQDLGRRA